MTDGARRLGCTACGASLPLRAAGLSLVVACEHCGAVLDAADPALAVLSAEKTAGEPPRLPLGAKGELQGVVWQLIGHLRRRDAENFEWEEFLLFNPLRGFRWLVLADNHWTLVRMLKHKAEDGGPGQKKLFGRTYKFSGKSVARVVSVRGEFYWRVKVGDEARTLDYAASPELLSIEVNGDEEIHSLGEFVPARKVRRAFLPRVHRVQDRDVPFPELDDEGDLAAHQPPSHLAAANRRVIRTFGALIAALAVIQALTVAGGIRDRELYSREFAAIGTTQDQVFLSQVEVPGEVGDLTFHLEVPRLNDAWFELQLDLVNSAGVNFPVETGLEVWDGEGVVTVEHTVTGIPGGTYDLILRPATSATDFATLLTWFLLKIRRDTVSWLNAVLAFFALAAYPLWRRMRQARYVHIYDGDV